MAPCGKELSEDLKKRTVALHKEGLGYTKIAKTLKLSCSMVSKTIQWFHRTGSIQNRPCHGRPKKLNAHAQCHIQRLGNRRVSAASIAEEVEG
ncbi:Transposable element Tc1 transposase, partial [Pelobates cultripes]